MNLTHRDKRIKRVRIIAISSLLASMLFFVFISTLIAQEVEPPTPNLNNQNGQEEELLPPDLSPSSKLVNEEQATPGSTLHYTIILSNSGTSPAAGVKMTDTLNSNLTYLSGGVVSGGGLYGEDGGVITWTGGVNNGSEVIIEFEAMIDELVTDGTVITNTAEVGYSEGLIILPPVATTVITQSEGFIYMPFLSSPPASVTLNPIGRPNSSNQWTLSWSISNPSGVTGYEVQEAHDPNFTNPTTIPVSSGTTSLVRSNAPSPRNIYYYRVRAIGDWGATLWSNSRQVIGNYSDSFNDPNTGWAMRRQDTDTVINQVYYRNGNLVLEMDSSYDYQIAAPMAPAPQMPYRIEASIQLAGVDNLHAYGLVFGGDWNGQICPNPDYSTCFNQYYRLSAIWSGELDDRMTMILKRIDYHEPDDNVGRGPDLLGPYHVNVSSPAQGYQVWAIEVYPDGLIKVFVNGNQVGEVRDTTYIDRPYFGAFSSTDEYTGLEAEFDWYNVSILP